MNGTGRDRLLGIGVACVGLALASCDSKEIRAYRTPKEAPSTTAPAPGSMAGPAPATVPTGRPSWTVPEGWQSVGSEQPGRIGTFKFSADSPEVAITAFPGDVGGTLANVNRWRGQLGMAPIDESQLAGAIEAGDANGVKVGFVDLQASDEKRMLGAMLSPGDGQTWFVKVTGPSKVIEGVKPAFQSFVKSFKFGPAVASAPAQPAASQAPMMQDQPDILPAPIEAGGDVASRLPAWKAPENWKTDPNASKIVTAAYNTTGAQGATRVTLTFLMTDGGGTLANLNRWREQMGVGPVTNLKDANPVQLAPNSFLVEIDAPGGDRGMLAAIVPAGGGTWYFKLTGAPKAIADERASFERFVREVGLGQK